MVAKPKTPEQMRRELAMKTVKPMPGMKRRYDTATGTVKLVPKTPKELARQARP